MSHIYCYACRTASPARLIADKNNMRFGSTTMVLNLDRKIYKCLRCGLIQMYPRAKISYTGYSTKKDFPGQERKVRISRYLTKYINRNDTILEVGCGACDNVRYLVKKGYNVTGLDKHLHGCWPTLLCDVFDYKPKEKFDVIYGIHFLEHLPDPRRFLEWLKNTLHPSGRFIFEVPCVEDPLLKLYKSKAFDKFYWYPYHMFFYDKKTLSDLFREFNIKVYRRQEYGIINHLRWLFRRKPGNWNPDIPIIDTIYKRILIMLGYSDSLVVTGGRCLT